MCVRKTFMHYYKLFKQDFQKNSVHMGRLQKLVLTLYIKTCSFFHILDAFRLHFHTPLLENSLRNESITGAESIPVVAKWEADWGKDRWEFAVSRCSSSWRMGKRGYYGTLQGHGPILW